MNAAPQHYYMVTALITYTRENADSEPAPAIIKPKQRHLNIVMTTPRKTITASALDNVRVAAIQRFCGESGVSSGDIKDIVFLSFSYLGLMAPNVFHDRPLIDKPASSPTLN